MATPSQPTDPAQLGADQSPDTTGQPLGSDFDQQPRQGAAGSGSSTGEASQGLGCTADNGDEDRTYDQNAQRGDLGSSGGRENHADRHTDTDANPYTSGNSDQPSAEQTKTLGLNTPSPADKPQ